MSTDWLLGPGITAPGQMVFAIGDIHGYYQQLKELRQLIQTEIDKRPNWHSKIVYLGDYIDRGPQSKEVLEFVTREWLESPVETVFLAGNHEYFLKSLLALEDDDDQQDAADNTLLWLQNGGDAVIKSLQLSLQAEDFADLRRFRDRVAGALGPDVLAFLRGLRLWHREARYLFVHAGVDPLSPFLACELEELIWMRQPFLDAEQGWNHDFAVVHGHTPARPEILAHRIGVDTGVYMSEALTAVQLYDCKARFLTVANDDPRVWQEELRWGRPMPYRSLSKSASHSGSTAGVE